MANRLGDDAPATPGSGKLALREAAAKRDVFDEPTVVSTVPEKLAAQALRAKEGDAAALTEEAGEATTVEPAPRASRASTGKTPRPTTGKTPRPATGKTPRPAVGKPRLASASTPPPPTRPPSPRTLLPDASSQLPPVEEGDAQPTIETNALGDAGEPTMVTALGDGEPTMVTVPPEVSAPIGERAAPGAGSTSAPARRALPKAAGNRLPSPTHPPRLMPVMAPPVSAAKGRPASEPPTDSAHLAVPVAIASSTDRKVDVTAVVNPLPPPAPARESSRVIVDPALGSVVTSERAPAARDAARPRNRSLRLGATVIGGAMLVAAGLVVAIGFSSDEAPRLRADEPVAAPVAAPAAPAPATAPAPAAAPIEAPAAPPAAASTAPPTAPPIEPAPAPAPVVAAPSPVEPPEIEMSPTPESAPPHPPRIRTRSAGVSTTRELARSVQPVAPAPKPAKPAKPLTYDPDALFLKKP